MSLRNIMKLLEVRTLVASVFPVLLGTAYSWYLYDTVNIVYLLMLLLAMCFMQGSANMINDCSDYLSGADGHEKSDEKPLVSGDVTPKQVLILIIILQVMSLILGVVIGSETSYYIVLIGMIGSMVSMLYATGPLPISNTPFGEIISGLTMGVGITTTVIFIHSGHVNVTTILMAVPSAMYIGTILLSNNISDMKEDEEANRKTLPLVIGLEYAERLWIMNVYGIFFSIVLLWIMDVYPSAVLIAVFLVVPFGVKKKFLSYEKNRGSKGMTMGIIGKIGVKYHIALIVGLVIDKLTA